ncbi:hypothetical protein ACIRJS_33020 [Streptomyces sp. NPDC102340]|uniref:hypothetical protein n=1 Tax=unclassified Streptomyces TaxID=2593676 RepID=UPI0038233765
MAQTPENHEAFRTAAGMIRAAVRKDSDGFNVLWYEAEDPAKVAGWLASIAAVGAIDSAGLRGVSVDEWFETQERVFLRGGE